MNEQNSSQKTPLWNVAMRAFVTKELRETLRDRRTVITLLAMPLLLYPLLGLGMRYLAVSTVPSAQEATRIALQTEPEANWFRAMLRATYLSERIEGSDEYSEEWEFFVMDPESGYSIEEAVANHEAEVGVRVRFYEEQEIPKYELELLGSEASGASRRAVVLITRILDRWNLKDVVVRSSFESVESAVRLTHQTEWTSGETASLPILQILPLVLLMMTVTGGVYPSIDLTAGERERNTMEALMALPVSRFRLLVAKYIAVIVVTLLTGLMNLTAMLVTIYSLQLDGVLFGEQGLSVGLILLLFAVMFAFALFFSAALLLVTSSAQSFKEAQAYLIPLLLLSITPGFVILFPGMELSIGLAAVPVVNMLMLARDLLAGEVQKIPALIAFGTTLVYAGLCLAGAAKVFGSNAFSVGSTGGWNQISSVLEADQRVPQTPAVFMLLGFLFPVFLIASGLAQRGAEVSLFFRLFISAALTWLLFVLIPLAVAKVRQWEIKPTFGIEGKSWQRALPALLLGLSTWPWIFEIVISMQQMGIGLSLPENFDKVEEMLAAWKNIPAAFLVLSLGLTPAVCEEFFFRGFLLNNLQRNWGTLRAWIVSSVAFGSFHVILAGGLAPERVVPSTLMGLLLGWVFIRSGGLVPGIVLHAVHNSTLLLMARYRDELAGWQVGVLEQSHLPASWLAGAGCSFAVGLLWMFFLTAKKAEA